MDKLIEKLASFKGSILGTYASFFLIWNWKIFLFFSGEGHFINKVEKANEMFRSLNLATASAYLFPVLFTFLYFLLIKPLASRMQVIVLKKERRFELNEKRARDGLLAIEEELLNNNSVLSEITQTSVLHYKDILKRNSYFLKTDAEFGTKNLSEDSIFQLCDDLIHAISLCESINKLSTNNDAKVDLTSLNNMIACQILNIEKLKIPEPKDEKKKKRLEELFSYKNKFSRSELAVASSF